MPRAILLAMVTIGAFFGIAQAKGDLFYCQIGQKHLSLTVSDGQLKYEYGPEGAPELTLESPLTGGTASWRYDLYNRAENKMLRFQRGNYSYVVFNIWSAPNSDMTGARDFSGVLVFKAGKEISRRFCNDGGVFETEIDLSMMPDAGDKLSELIANIEEPKAADD